ncbi:hypothetical protein M0811_10390 [Anaeramoeba ignava]|uniref:Uncharacterized protein n=1 Tax=Anaeramoeba ignava TaxID=1746090 RepID=A0A9Q0LEN7_ANAIG|nr:hypothetical protein M0811_10390 [Anaeramoeba ignava]
MNENPLLNFSSLFKSKPFISNFQIKSYSKQPKSMIKNSRIQMKIEKNQQNSLNTEASFRLSRIKPTSFFSSKATFNSNSEQKLLFEVGKLIPKKTLLIFQSKIKSKFSDNSEFNLEPFQVQDFIQNIKFSTKTFFNDCFEFNANYQKNIQINKSGNFGFKMVSFRKETLFKFSLKNSNQINSHLISNLTKNIQIGSKVDYDLNTKLLRKSFGFSTNFFQNLFQSKIQDLFQLKIQDDGLLKIQI